MGLFSEEKKMNSLGFLLFAAGRESGFRVLYVFLRVRSGTEKLKNFQQ